MYPTNSKLDHPNFGYKNKDPSLPDDQFEPPLNSISGANYYERESQLLYVVVKGSVAVDIRTAPVIQVKLGKTVEPVSANYTAWENRSNTKKEMLIVLTELYTSSCCFNGSFVVHQGSFPQLIVFFIFIV